MKVLIIGLGSIARKHINALNSLTSCQIYALRSNKDAEHWPGVTNVFDLEEIIWQVDFVILSNPTSLHYQFILSLLDFGKPLFIEKPPIHTLQQAKGLFEKIDRKNLITYVACNLRFHPAIKYLKENLTTDALNEVNVYCGSYLPEWRPDNDFRKIYSAIPEMGGGVHLDLYHEIDYMAWLLGLPDGSKVYKSNKSTLRIKAIDYANYLWTYRNFNVSIILNYYRIKPKRAIEFLFEDTIWKVDLLSNKIIEDDNKIIFNSEFNMLDTYTEQMAYFINSLKNNEQPMNGLLESFEKMKICLADEY